MMKAHDRAGAILTGRVIVAMIGDGCVIHRQKNLAAVR